MLRVRKRKYLGFMERKREKILIIGVGGVGGNKRSRITGE